MVIAIIIDGNYLVFAIADFYSGLFNEIMLNLNLVIDNIVSDKYYSTLL